MPDPIAGLEHDHVAFSEAVAQVKALLTHRSSGRAPSGGDPAGPQAPADAASDLRTVRLVESLRDDLLAHFAKEEEGLFPFLARELPDVAADIDRLLAGHETVCGCIVRLAHCLSTVRGRDESATGLVERFEQAYAEHARREVLLLREVGGRLDPAQRRELAALIKSL